MNMRIYEKARVVPDEAKKQITAGRIKGMTDINPMWRIKLLTELFGPCGIGWWYEVVEKRVIPDEITKQSAAFVDILLYYKDPKSGELSHGIPGTGGSSFVAQEKNGAYMSDECFKMALTDAISVAAKALGVGADVYYAKDRTKYDSNGDDVKMETVEDAKGFVLNFGKYNGKTLGSIYTEDIGYIDWLYDNEKTDPIVKKALEMLYRAHDKQAKVGNYPSAADAFPLSPRQQLNMACKRKGINAAQYAAQIGIDKSTPDALVLQAVAQLGGMSNG